MAFEAPRRVVRALEEAEAASRSPGAAGTAVAPTGPGAADAAWLAGLPERVGAAAERDGLSIERVHAPGGRSSVVVLVRRPDGSPAVLKLAPPGAGPRAERAALLHWDGFGAVRLLDGDGDGVHSDEGGDGGPSGAAGPGLLLERLHPEVSVRSLPEAKSMLEAAGTLRRLWVEPPAADLFETVAVRTERQAEAMKELSDGASSEGGADGFGTDVSALVDAALAARTDLLASEPADDVRLLHGTFRQSKVLAGERMPWLAVGPDPVVGERAFDLARLVRDRVEDLIAAPSGAATARRRVKRLAESLEVDQERLRGWTLFRSVESGTRALRVGRRPDAELLLEFAAYL